MALGYCKTCHKLVPISPGPRKWDNGSKEQWWYPAAHDGADGKLCPGEKRPL